MSHEDRRKWDRKYLGAAPGPPAATLRRLASSLPASGRALDVACGTGGNTLFLAARGLRVDAVDCSRVGLAVLARSARDRQVANRIRPVLMDLDHPALTAAPGYDLLINISFLLRPLLPLLASLVRPGGMLLVDTFHRGYLAGRPSLRPEWVLERDEIRTLFPDLEPVLRGETDTRAFLLARRP